MTILVFDRIENIAGKEENSHNVFKKTSFIRCFKIRDCVVNGYSFGWQEPLTYFAGSIDQDRTAKNVHLTFDIHLKKSLFGCLP